MRTREKARAALHAAPAAVHASPAAVHAASESVAAASSAHVHTTQMAALIEEEATAAEAARRAAAEAATRATALADRDEGISHARSAATSPFAEGQNARNVGE